MPRKTEAERKHLVLLKNARRTLNPNDWAQVFQNAIGLPQRILAEREATALADVVKGAPAQLPPDCNGDRATCPRRIARRAPLCASCQRL